MKAENTQDQEERCKPISISELVKRTEETRRIINEIKELEKRKRYSNRLMRSKKICLSHIHHANCNISELLEWLMEDESSFELKIYCIENHSDIFSSPKEQYEWLIKDSLELSQSDVENDGGCGHRPCPNLGCQKVYE